MVFLGLAHRQRAHWRMAQAESGPSSDLSLIQLSRKDLHAAVIAWDAVFERPGSALTHETALFVNRVRKGVAAELAAIGQRLQHPVEGTGLSVGSPPHALKADGKGEPPLCRCHQVLLCP